MSQRLLAPLFSVLTFLSILLLAFGGLGTGRAQGGVDSQEQRALAPAAPVGSAFAYQGELLDRGRPANGVYDLRFWLFDAETGGAQVGPIVGVNDLAVSDGTFSVSLDFGPVFHGQALWLRLAVRPGSSTGTFTILHPRQPLAPNPYALGVRPGAVVSQTAVAPALTLNSNGVGLSVGSAGFEGILVNDAAFSGIYVGSAGSDGLYVGTAGSPSRTSFSGLNNGLEVGGAEGHGLYVGRADGVGVHVESAFAGFSVGSADTYGLYVDSTGIEGIFVDSAGWDGVEVSVAGESGFAVHSAGDYGVEVNRAGRDGFFVCRTGAETTCDRSPSNNGLEIGSAQHNGVHVESAGRHGLNIISAGLNGVRILSSRRSGILVHTTEATGVSVVEANLNGLLVGSAGLDGVNVAGDDLAGRFHGPIVATSCGGCLVATFGVNSGRQALAPGAIVTIRDMRASGVDGIDALMEVVAATAGEPVVGVVQGRAELRIAENPRPDETGRQLIPREGPAEPGEYVTIIFSGPVQVKASELDGPIAAGTRLTVAGDGQARPLQEMAVALADGGTATMTEQVHTIGVALSAVDEKGMVWVLVNPQ